MDNTGRKYLETGGFCLFFKPRKAGASAVISVFSYYRNGLHMKQLEFLASMHYVKASYVFSNRGEKLGQLGISQVYFCFWKLSKEISQPSREPLN